MIIWIQVLAHGASALPWYEDSSHWRGTRWERQSIAVLCPKNQIGRIIGRGGGTVKQLQHISGARISVSYLDEVGLHGRLAKLASSVSRPLLTLATSYCL
jgi:hypothetical protein